MTMATIPANLLNGTELCGNTKNVKEKKKKDWIFKHSALETNILNIQL